MLYTQDFTVGDLPNPLFANPPPRQKIPPPPIPVPAPVPVARQVEEVLPTPVPAKDLGPYRADAARRDGPKRNIGEAARAARATKALAGTSRTGPSMSSLHLSSFPVPGQTVSHFSHRPPSTMSVEEDSGYATPNSSTAGSRSVAQLTNFNGYSRKGSVKAPSLRTSTSNASKASKTAGSLKEDVGFTFKATCNFVHPERKLPRASKRSSFRSSARSTTYQEEDESTMADRMNSATSDGGWQLGWSVGGASNRASLDGSCERSSSIKPDLAPDEESAGEEVPPTIEEEREDQFHGILEPTRSGSESPVRRSTIDIGRVSLRSRKSSLSTRSRREDSESTILPSRSSFDRALGILSKGSDNETEDADTRAAKIAAARRAFDEKEAAKDRKWADQEAKKEMRRRRSEAAERTSSWVRRPSNAIDSPVESIDEEKASTPPSKRSMSMTRRSTEEEDDDYSCDPLSTATCAADAAFPAYRDSLSQDSDRPVFRPVFEEVPALFPAMKSVTAISMSQGGGGEGLFPVPSRGQYYLLDGTWYNEFGEEVSSEVQEALEQEQPRRALSVAKQAKGRMNKLSAWSKTRLLRV